jgi:hypothetical protein
LDDVLQRLADDADYAPAGWDAVEVDHFRLVAECADSAIAVQDLRAMRCLRLRLGSDNTVASVPLSATRMLTIKFETSGRLTAVLGLVTAGTGAGQR